MRTIGRDGAALGLGALGLGIVGLTFSSFALQWQPVPAGWPAQPTLAIVSALILIAGGLASVAGATSRIGGAILAAWFGLWAVALHLPLVAAKPSVVTLLGLAEITALASAAMLLAAIWGGVGARSWARVVPRVAFGLSAIVFGISHFVYADFTAQMVPAWLPGRLFFAYLTGAGHFAAGIAILAGVLTRLAATLLAAMCGLFVILLHAPRVAAAPKSQVEWTMLFIALSIAGAAWITRRAGDARR